MARYVVGFRGDRRDAGRGRRRQGRAPGGAVADRRHPRAGWLLRDDGRLPADHGGSAVDRRSARSAVAPEAGRPGGDPRAQRGDPPDHRRDRHPRRSGGGDHPRRSPGSASKPPTPSDPARRRRTLPTASFAGQQDTYLNVVGPAAILRHVSRCWASLFTERAVTYRLRNGIDHRKVHMAVVVQQMVFPQAAGILFTADPVTGNRKVASVEASFGLGEALVSGLVNADVYKVRDGEVVAKAVGTKQLAIHASPAGGTQEQAIEPERQEQPALTDAQVVRLAQLGPADRSALRPPPGHRMVPGRRWLPDRPEPADHHAVPHPRGRRPREPRLRLRRSSADDDRPHEAPGALLLPADDPAAHGRGRREAVRRRHRAPGFAGEPRRPPGGCWGEAIR